MPTLSVEIFFATGSHYSAWSLGTGALGRVTLAPADIATYVDVTSAVRSLSIDRGKARELDQYEAGRASVGLDNRDRDFDPLNLSGPYVSLGVTQVRPGRRIRIKATHPTTLIQYTLYEGTVWEWSLDYLGKFDSLVTARATDVMSTLANSTVNVVTSAGQTGLAVGQVMDAAGVAEYSVATCNSTLQVSTFTSSALEALRTLEASEQGAFYVESNGEATFANRTALIADSRSNTSQATFGVGVLDYESIALSYAGDLIKNSVSLTRTGGVTQTASDATSILDYGTRSLALTGLANSTDAEVLSTASYIVSRWKDPKVRVASISFSPRKSAELMTQALSRRIRDRVTVQFVPAGGGTISQELFIIGIHHAVVAAEWSTTFEFENTDGSVGWLLGTGALGTTTQLAF